MKKKVILLFTIACDPHADKVVRILDKKGCKVVRIDTDKLSKTSSIVFKKIKLAQDIYIVTGNKKYFVESFQSIWIRKPFLKLYEKTKNNIKQILAMDYKFDEHKNICIPFVLEAQKNKIFILNYHDKIMTSSFKLLQLFVAQKIGLNVPDSIVSSNVKEIKNFFNIHDNKGIIKELGNALIESEGKEVIFTTNLFSEKEFSLYHSSDSLDYPLFVQEEIKKREELRITVVGNKIFACSIDTQAYKESQIDSRLVYPYKLKHRIVKLPREIEECCFKICKYFNLQFGAIDMAITPEGKFVFFEINPNGQYLWIEDITKAPISEAIANLLMDPKKYSIK